MMFAKKAKYFLLGTVGGIFIALVAVDHYANLFYYQPNLQLRLSELRSAEPKILADLKLVDQTGIFTDLGTSKNAEELFGPHLSWQGTGAVPVNDPNLEKISSFLAKYKMWEKQPDKLKEMLRDQELNIIDVAWVDRVLQYDHWEFSVNPLAAKAIDKATRVDAIGRIGLFAGLPIPSYSQLRDCVIVRFLQLHNRQREHEGLKILRKTAALTYSSGLLVGAMSAVRLLQNESYLADALDIRGWTTVSKEATDAFKRVSWAWVAILNTSVGGEVSEEILAYAKPKNGICSAAIEITPDINLEREYLTEQFPFESSHRDGLARIKRLSEKFLKNCNLEQLGQVMHRPANFGSTLILPEFEEFSETGLDMTRRVNVSLIPYFRRAYGYYYSANRIGYLGAYKNL